jgi:hypothetical protein
MKKFFLVAMTFIFGISVMAQQKIQLRSVDKAECVKSDMRGIKASFSFSTIDAQDYQSDRGTFTWLSLPNTVIGGDAGDPQLPVINQLIAVPFGANPCIEITSYSTTDYRLEDYDMKTLVPRQPSVRKDQRPEDVPFIMNDAAYQTRGLRSEPTASVSVEGTMRGIQLGTMTIEPVSYDPVNNTIRVFNDIEVTVRFDGADTQATEDMLLRTYSPAFEPVYAQLFNGRAVTDVYTQHPDLYNTPVKMLVICYSGFKNNTALNNWLKWKLQKGYYVDIFYTDQTGTSAANIKSFIQTKYNASVSAGNAYTYLIVIGDTGQVPQYMTKTVDYACASDLGYSAVNFTTSNTTNYFPDMYYSRMSVENTTHLTNYINKVLTYERYEFADGGNYLNNVLLVGGWDSYWTSRVAKPTINYGKNNYFNTSNTTYGGFSGGTIHAVISTSSSQGYSGTNHGVYNGINDGACIVNYTAHGDRQEWQVPQFTAAQVATLTNTGKYFFGIGNCCLTGNFNNTTTSYSPGSAIGANACFGETMIRVPNAGAVAYVGCSPYSYWYEDLYWAVGAHSYSAGNAPSVSGSSKGVYDVMFADQYWNSASALLYLGNLAVQQAVTNGNQTSSITDGNCQNSAHYYFQFYHTFGDGSVMPYITKPEVNTVTIPSIVTPGTNSITVNALAGSYVAVTDNNSVIYGVAEANASGVASVNFTQAIPSSGTLYVVVTRQQYQPYFGTIEVVGGTQYTIGATASPTNGGTVSGAGQYYESTECTLTATANEGYTFVNWTKNGVQVSTNPSYIFTVTAGGNYVANFSLNSYAIAASATPSVGGTISGAGTYNHFASCTLTAAANEGYTFINWTEDGSQVSTDAEYSFTVNGARTLVANFSLNRYQVMATSNPAEAGAVAIGGNPNASELVFDFENGNSQGWTILQGLGSDSPNNWTHSSNYTAGNFSAGQGHNSSNGFMLSESLVDNNTPVHPDNYLVSPQILLGGSISFWATNLDNYFGAEHFGVAISTGSGTDASEFTVLQEWTLPVERTGSTRSIDDGTWYEYTTDLSAFSGMGYVAIRHFDCTDQWLLCVDDITIVEGYSFNHGELCTLTATANEGYTFVNWTENGVEVSNEATYSFTVTSDRDLVASFAEQAVEVEQTLMLNQGWSWWSTNLDITLEQLEDAIAAAVGTTGTATIKSKNGSITYANGRWRESGSSTMTLDIRQMYKIQTSTACQITLTGVPVNPADYEITINEGYNWIGFPCGESMSVTEAFSGLHPVNGDVIKSKNGSSIYQGTSWRGDVETLVPGQGYIYQSKTTGSKTFTYGTDSNK